MFFKNILNPVLKLERGFTHGPLHDNLLEPIFLLGNLQGLLLIQCGVERPNPFQVGVDRVLLNKLIDLMRLFNNLIDLTGQILSVVLLGAGLGLIRPLLYRQLYYASDGLQVCF